MHEGHAEAVEGLAPGRAVGLVAARIAVADAEEFCRTAHVEPDEVISSGNGAALGIEGKWAIHPSQIALANEVFTPPPAEIERARRILDALDQAAKEGRGAAQLDGRMIDAASARMAQNVVNTADALGGK